MQSENRIGTLAEKIVAVRINQNGTLIPMLRRRAHDGRLIDCAISTNSRTPMTKGTEFVVRVPKGSTGLLVMRSPMWDIERYDSVLIPVGSTRPFSDFDASPHEIGASDTAEALSEATDDEVWFTYSGDKLVWRNGSTSGEMRIDESFPELTVTLRLPPGNEGEISFETPLFTTATGERTGVLAVA